MRRPTAVRLVAILMVAGFHAVATAGQAPASAPAAITELAWLEGTWVAETNGTRVEERWTSPAGGAMLGTGRTLRGGRMVAFEFLRIVARPDGVVYIAQPGGRPPTEFALSAGGQDRAVFENPAHDFPTRLTYRRSGRTLRVEVEGIEQGKPLRDVYEFTLADVR